MRNTQRSNSGGCFLALLLGCFLLPSLSLAATVTYSSNKVMGPTNGLVGYWTMNAQDINWTTNTILDRSGYGNNGSISGMNTKSAPYIGKVGQALRFDGVDDMINAGSASSLDDLPQMTISLWTRELGSGENGTGNAITKSTGSTPTGGWQLRTQGSISFVVRTSGTNMSLSTLYTPLSDHQWHHVLITWNGGILASGAQLFIDGRQATNTLTFDGSVTRTSDSTYNLTLGNNPENSRTLNGSLDDVRIYNRILSPTEITQLYKVGQVQLASTPKKNTSGLVGWWTFDGPDFLTTVADRSGNANHGFVIGQPTTTTKTAGMLGQGLKLNGTTGYISAGTNNVLNVTGNTMTFSSWVRRTTPGSAGTLIYRGDIGFNGYIVALGSTPCTANQIKATKFGVVDVCLSGFPADTAWHHVVVAWGVSGTTLYIDGVPTDNNANSASFISASGALLTIGTFAGTLDDVRIYNRILTVAEVAKLYKEGQVTLKGAPLCPAGGTVKDADGNIYHVVKIGTQCWLKENMRVGTRINVASNQTNNAIIEKYCYGDIPAFCTANHPNNPDGGLYRWDEAMQYSTSPGAQGICPSGWHIPTHNEFTTLERAVCTSGTCATDFPYDTTTTGGRGTAEGTKLIPGGTSGFEGNLSGYYSWASLNRGFSGFFWSSSESGSAAWYRSIVAAGEVGRNTIDKISYGMSVRCLKN